VEAFDSGAAALEGMDRIEPDLILADVVMPEPSGYELCKRVKALGAGIPVVLLSSTFEPYDSELAEASGADGHLIKPFESGTLVDTVRELLGPPSPPPGEDAEAGEREAELSQVDDAIEALIDADDSAESDDETEPEELGEPATDLDERLVDAVSKAVVQRLSEQVIREIAREVVPDLAERIIRERIRQLESDDD